MSGTASGLRKHQLEVGWAVFTAANLAAMGMLAGVDGGTVPFHFIWVSLTIVYGYTVWSARPTIIVLSVVMSTTAAMILLEIVRGPTRPDELTEVPLMAAMFVAMVWHARRRSAAEHVAIRSREREREFIRDSSHHLKTPLQLARSYSELLRAGLVTEQQHHDSDALITELDRLGKIVNGLLVFMTSEEPQLLDRRPADVEELVFGVVGRWMDAVDRTWHVDVRDPGMLNVDSNRLELALDALIENAVAATSPAGRISLIATGSGSAFTIRVVDDGHGIPADAIDQVFDRFWTRGGRVERRGTGLGLAIVKAIVDAHEGSVEVRSGGFGTEFSLTLDAFTPAGSPVGPVAPADDRLPTHLAAASH